MMPGWRIHGDGLRVEVGFWELEGGGLEDGWVVRRYMIMMVVEEVVRDTERQEVAVWRDGWLFYGGLFLLYQ